MCGQAGGASYDGSSDEVIMGARIVAALIVTLLTVGNAQADTFDGYECLGDCSGHQAGFDWAEQNQIADEASCSTPSTPLTKVAHRMCRVGQGTLILTRGMKTMTTSEASGERPIQGDEHSPLMPQSALDYYWDERNVSLLYHKAGSIHSCLENIVDTIFVHLVEPGDKKVWRQPNLNKRIDLLRHFFPEDVIQRLHNLRSLGNDGAHQANHRTLSEDRIRDGLRDLGLTCELTLLTYLRKHGLRSKAWVATVFSTLPPVYRVRILEQLLVDRMLTLDRGQVFAQQELRRQWNEQRQMEDLMRARQGLPFNDQHPEETDAEAKISDFLTTLDKLAMAYLKNKQFDRSFEFVREMHASGWMTDTNADYTWGSLEALQSQLHRFPIATSLEEARRNLQRVLPSIEEHERSHFITLFSAIVLGSPEDISVDPDVAS